MTTYTLGPCPDEDAFCSDFNDRDYVAKDYADWQRRRAQQAEALLQEAMHLHCLRDPDDELEVLRADVAAHFDQVKP